MSIQDFLEDHSTSRLVPRRGGEHPPGGRRAESRGDSSSSPPTPLSGGTRGHRRRTGTGIHFSSDQCAAMSSLFHTRPREEGVRPPTSFGGAGFGTVPLGSGDILEQDRSEQQEQDGGEQQALGRGAGRGDIEQDGEQQEHMEEQVQTREEGVPPISFGGGPPASVEQQEYIQKRVNPILEALTTATRAWLLDKPDWGKLDKPEDLIGFMITWLSLKGAERTALGLRIKASGEGEIAGGMQTSPVPALNRSQRVYDFDDMVYEEEEPTSNDMVYEEEVGGQTTDRREDLDDCRPPIGRPGGLTSFGGQTTEQWTYSVIASSKMCTPKINFFPQGFCSHKSDLVFSLTTSGAGIPSSAPHPSHTPAGPAHPLSSPPLPPHPLLFPPSHFFSLHKKLIFFVLLFEHCLSSWDADGNDWRRVYIARLAKRRERRENVHCSEQ